MTIIVLLTFVVVLVDQFTKYVVLERLSDGSTLPIIQNILHFTLVKNTGIAFGLFKSNTVLVYLCIIVGIVIVGLMLFAHSCNKWYTKVAVSLLMGGAIGNVIDRLRYGAVIDFIDLRVWPVFNIADTCISVAAGIFLLTIFLDLSKERK